MLHRFRRLMRNRFATVVQHLSSKQTNVTDGDDWRLFDCQTFLEVESAFSNFLQNSHKYKEMSAEKEKNAKGDLGLLEEDDEFEEFPAEDFNVVNEDEEEVNVWEDNWDDDNVEDDFNQQLKSHLEKQAMES